MNAGWQPVSDDDGNLNVPSSERQVMVFLSGDRSLSAERAIDQGWGIKLGWWDTEKQYWRSGGKIERYVTHWRELPNPPITAQ